MQNMFSGQLKIRLDRVAVADTIGKARESNAITSVANEE